MASGNLQIKKREVSFIIRCLSPLSSHILVLILKLRSAVFIDHFPSYEWHVCMSSLKYKYLLILIQALFVVQPTHFASVGFTFSKSRKGLLKMTVFCFTNIHWFSRWQFLLEVESLVNIDCHLYKP